MGTYFQAMHNVMQIVGERKYALVSAHTSEVSQLHTASAKINLAEAQNAVGGYVELVHLDDGYIMLVNEEGQLERLEFNDIASMIAEQTIVGNVVICQNDMF